MELISFYDYVNKYKDLKLCCALGQFDGVHLAHQALINQTTSIAKDKNLKSAVLTFDPHPAVVFANKVDITLTSLSDKKKILENFGVDFLIYLNFTKEFARVSPLDFVNDYLLKINVCECVVGFDYSFGYLGKGKATDIESLSQGLIKTTIVEEIKHNGKKISSTEIRNLLQNGQIEEVKDILGFNYSFTGHIIHGRGVGSKIGVPTANVSSKDVYPSLKLGVYGVCLYKDNVKYLGMMNVGHNPSFNYYEGISIEVCLFDVEIDLYDSDVLVECFTFVRPEQVFNSVDEFLTQIKHDKETIITRYNTLFKKINSIKFENKLKM